MVVSERVRGPSLAVEWRLDAAVAALLVGTAWVREGVVWRVEAALYGLVRVRSATAVEVWTGGEWLGNPDVRRLPCRRVLP
jgi:hypothetical protein